MADHALFIGWGRTLPGREQQALQVFNDAMQYYGRLKQQGDIESFEAFSLGAHGGDLYGFMLLRGDTAKLAQISASEEFTRLTMRADLALEHMGVVPAVTGNELIRLFADYQQLAKGLAQ
jgi:hypothetical protein